VPYGSHARQRLDIYGPTAPIFSPLPTLLFFYGGSWRSGFREGYEFVGRALSAQGFVVGIADYRLVPDVRFPSFLEDCAAAAKLFLREAPALGGREKSIILAGQSAGAYNAAMLSLDRRWLGEDWNAVRGFVGLAGLYTFSAGANPITAAAFGNAAPAETQPLNFVRTGSPPCLLLHGEKDRVVHPRSSALLADRLRKAGVRAKVKLYPELDHIGIVGALAQPFRKHTTLLTDMVAFIRAVTT